MPVVSSLLGIFGATLGLYVLTRPEPPNFVDPANYIRDLVLSDDEMCGLTTGGMEECWWGCKFQRKILPWINEYDVSLHIYLQQCTAVSVLIFVTQKPNDIFSLAFL